MSLKNLKLTLRWIKSFPYVTTFCIGWAPRLHTFVTSKRKNAKQPYWLNMWEMNPKTPCSRAVSNESITYIKSSSNICPHVTHFRTLSLRYAQNIARNGFNNMFLACVFQYLKILYLVIFSQQTLCQTDLSTLRQAHKLSAFQGATCCVRTHFAFIFVLAIIIFTAFAHDHTLWQLYLLHYSYL